MIQFSHVVTFTVLVVGGAKLVRYLMPNYFTAETPTGDQIDEYFVQAFLFMVLFGAMYFMDWFGGMDIKDYVGSWVAAFILFLLAHVGHWLRVLGEFLRHRIPRRRFVDQGRQMDDRPY